MFQDSLDQDTIYTPAFERQLVTIGKKLNVVTGVDVKGYEVEIRIQIE
jgi:hypothetical protein